MASFISFWYCNLGLYTKDVHRQSTAVLLVGKYHVITYYSSRFPWLAFWCLVISSVEVLSLQNWNADWERALRKPLFYVYLYGHFIDRILSLMMVRRWRCNLPLAYRWPSPMASLLFISSHLKFKSSPERQECRERKSLPILRPSSRKATLALLLFFFVALRDGH